MTSNSFFPTEAPPGEVFVTPQLFEEILQAPENLVTIHTPVVDDIVAQFQQLSRRTGKVVYRWSDESGLVSLRDADFVVPGSKRMTDALRYVLQSMHFGVYLFTDFDRQLRLGNVGLLRQLARLGEGNERKVILVASELKLPASLTEVCKQVVHKRGSNQRPRLRDGRWVL